MSRFVKEPYSQSTPLLVPGSTTTKEKFASTRLSRATVLLRESRTVISLPPARMVDAFDAICLCCCYCEELSLCVEPEHANANPDVVLAVADLLVAMTKKLGLHADAVDLTLRLMQWSFFGRNEDMPCTPERALELAEEVLRKTMRLQSNSGEIRI
jgi:hypothetical protein